MNIFKKSAVTFYAGVRGQLHMNNTTMKHLTNLTKKIHRINERILEQKEHPFRDQ